MFLSDVSIKRPVFATMMMVALVVLGVVSYKRLAIDEYPDLTYPVVIVNTTYPGASPEVMVREVSKPVEEAVNTVQGIREVTSTSLEGASIVRVLFNLGVDVDIARQDVQAKVARIRRQLPPNIEDPIIQTFDPNSSPIVSIAVQSNERSIRELTDLADELISTRIEAIPGVGGVNLSGGNRRQIKVQLDPDAMRSYGVSPQNVIDALQRENQEVPAGRVRAGATEQLVRISGRIVDPMAFNDVTVAVRGGVPVRIRDVGDAVQHELALGAVLTIMIVYLFLNSWRSTVITGLTLPISIISAFFIMWVFNFTVNTMTLLALSLSIGLLIDDAIVVRENIVRHLEMGKDHYRASKEGTDEIGLAVISTTLAVMAVFIPVAFMGGMIGRIFFQFGVTVAFAVLVSLFVSFTLDPMLSSIWADPEVEHTHAGAPDDVAGHEATRRKAGPIRRVAFAFNDWFERTADPYPGWLRWALTHRGTMM